MRIYFVFHSICTTFAPYIMMQQHRQLQNVDLESGGVVE